MRKDCQPESFSSPRECPSMTLKFSARLNNFRRLKGWTICAMAEKIGMSADHLEYLLTGKHVPLALDIVKIERRLEIQFEPEDFEGEAI